MAPFWNRQATPDPRLVALEAEVAKLARVVRETQAECAELAERAYKHLKKAEARARRELDEAPVANQGRHAAKGGAATPPPVLVPNLTSVRARRLMRAKAQQELAALQPDDHEGTGTDGDDS